MTGLTRPYLFYDTAVSICSTCYRRVDAKIVFEDTCVYLTKHCPRHGNEKVLVSDDIPYYRQCREVFLKPPEMPYRRNTAIAHGCPYDCGLCPDHEQHSCLTLIEVTDACNLRCPVCYAGSGPERQTHRSLETIERMLDAVVANEREPDIVQISGGEPTIHPDFFAILDAARRRPIRHLMVNTNGVRIARDPELAKRLASYMPGFELYLQFDSLRSRPLEVLRGADLRDVRMRALEHLNAAGISTTLVVTLQKGVNDDEIGEILDFALRQPCVRGITFQPVQAAGRLDGYDDASHRLTLSEVRRKILEQSPLFRPEDLIPVPCHPDALCMGYAFKTGDGAVPLTSMIDRQALIDGSRNTIVFERDDSVRNAFFDVFTTALGADSQPSKLKDLLCCIPRASVPETIGYANIFRVLILEFIDARSFDLRSVKKSCVHIAHPDGRIIPFDTYNMFYRDDLEQTRLAPLREGVERAWM
ncbi:MAG TPA: radical SAM protein [Thermoanaerobaculia bacterium]|nr:radical SAM protein [Thermoanaerobaculia bacterium]